MPTDVKNADAIVAKEYPRITVLKFFFLRTVKYPFNRCEKLNFSLDNDML